ncbi:MAG: CPBP family intramembrane metalloprotease [Pseudobutyrivibrio sp.]|nr:CPBP family intramembrane metalloprotease [Pseudobutyrivibrio sp.]
MKKVLTFIQAFLPFIVILALQMILIFVLSIIAGTQLISEQPDLASNQTLYKELISARASQMLPNAVMILHILNVIIMLFWFTRINKKDNTPGTSFKRSVTIKNIVMVTLIAIGIQCVITSGLNLINYMKPELLANYKALLDKAGITSSSVPGLIAATFLAPIGEELAFRGVTMRYLKKAGAGFWVVTILPAILFGVQHLNIVQGIYAAIIGFVLGYIMYKYDSIYLTILLHMIINTTSCITDLELLDTDNLTHILIMCLVGVIFSAAARYATITNPAVVPVETTSDTTQCA